MSLSSKRLRYETEFLSQVVSVISNLLGFMRCKYSLKCGLLSYRTPAIYMKVKSENIARLFSVSRIRRFCMDSASIHYSNKSVSSGVQLIHIGIPDTMMNYHNNSRFLKVSSMVYVSQ